jgi:hypothetical protein
VRASRSPQAANTPRMGVPTRGRVSPCAAMRTCSSRAKSQSGYANSCCALRARSASRKTQTSMLHTCTASPLTRV